LANDLTVTASGLDAGFDTVGGGIDSGTGNLTLDLNGIAKGNITTGAISSDATLTLKADTIGTLTTGATAGKSVIIDAADVLSTTSFGTITASSATIDGSNTVANTVTVDGTTSTTAATSITVDFDGGILVDGLTVNGQTSTNSITVKGDGGLGADTVKVTLADYATVGTADTVTVDVSGVVADTTNQTVITIETGADVDNKMTITGSKGTSDIVDLGTSKTYTQDISFSGIETLDFHTAVQLTAASVSGLEVTFTSNANTDNVVLDGAATADTVTYADVTYARGAAADFTINGNAGDDNITGSAGADTINGGDDDDTITGGEGADIITGGKGEDTITLTETTAAADIVKMSALATNGADTIVGFTSASDIIEIKGTGATYTEGADSTAPASAFLDGSASSKANVTAALYADGQANDLASGVIRITDEAAADFSDATTKIGAAITVDGTASNNAVQAIIIDNGTDTQVYHYADSTNGFDAADDLTLIATITGLEVADFVIADFDMA